MDRELRILALIYPIERHVGHWACSSASIEVERVIMEGDDLDGRILESFRGLDPHGIALIGKEPGAYHDRLDRLAAMEPRMAGVPRIYRCQNTVLAHRVAGMEPSREHLASLDHWFAFACDPRFSLVLVQTLDDVEIIGRALAPVLVAPCPYGYDPAVFNGDLPELPRTTDVGCYFNRRGDRRRADLADKAREICHRRGWSFRFVTGKYWHDYAELIRTTKVCLHLSDQGEVPFRMYETTILGSLFLTDPLRYSVERLFTAEKEYLTYSPDLSDLEETLEGILADEKRRLSISLAGRERAREYAWPSMADRYVRPALEELLEARAGQGGRRR